MSRVTNLIITTGLSENVSYLQEKLSLFMSNGLPFKIVSIDDETLPSGWYGGGKLMEANIFLGAFNYLELNELISFMRSNIDWDMPECVQLIVREQTEIKFKIIDLFSE